MARGDEFAVLAAQRAIVDRKLHLNGGRIDRLCRQSGTIRAVGEGLADENVLESGQPHDVPRMGFGHLDAFEALEVIDHRDLAFGQGTVGVDADGGLALNDLARMDLSERNAPEVIGIVQVGDQQLKPLAGKRPRRRDVFHDGLE